jgi:hypothetical protein
MVSVLRISMGSGIFKSSRVLRMHIERRRIWRLLNRFLKFKDIGEEINFRNADGRLRIGTLAKATKAPRSSMLFWIGVPVRHQ